MGSQKLTSGQSAQPSQVGYSNRMVEVENRKKVVIVGDGNSGKTSLLWRVENVDEKELPDFPPTVLEHRAFQLDDMFIEFVDTAGQEDFEYLRTQCYDGADLFIILCTADSQHSLQNVRQAWVKEVPDYKPRLLIMNKCDLEGECEEGTTIEDVEKAKSDLKMQGCLKVSARTGENVPELLELIRTRIKASKSKKPCCLLV